MGRPAERPRNERGQRIMALLEDQDLSLSDAARKVKTDFGTFRRFVHSDSPRTSVDLIVRVVRVLGLPLEVVCPRLAVALRDDLVTRIVRDATLSKVGPRR